ncbi:hypothetical protein CC1G_15760 [Coprinopsis cinerea okayama7|uniref:Uncharacterized protein n=1 Tax=Coprinopsis cinerea (strain Okayama-7 / 130 / ATCC MYA-4618 / FGSC 9003) TaxID=240176 RepID=D6RQX4_COPC7|nr:hypothetical protein CC1G_15760 [Coprinopsis cinerea okayama7\|eukprot:XP_002910041.1 hypothetical protein CC1G_15760 [Coprinopsis cinerea okayama7\
MSTPKYTQLQPQAVEKPHLHPSPTSKNAKPSSSCNAHYGCSHHPRGHGLLSHKFTPRLRIALAIAASILGLTLAGVVAYLGGGTRDVFFSGGMVHGFGGGVGHGVKRELAKGSDGGGPGGDGLGLGGGVADWGIALAQEVGSTSTGSGGDSPFTSQKLYLIVIFVGLFVVLVLGIMLSVWCCKGAFKNPLCCPCYLCACCGGLACLQCIGCGLCLEGLDEMGDMA